MPSVLSLATLQLLATTLVYGIDFYDSRYDNFDITPIIENDRILNSYINCFLGKGPCTPDGKDFKKTIPEALESSCGKCTPRQRELIKKVINALVNKNPQAWKELLNKFDPENKYRTNIYEFINSP